MAIQQSYYFAYGSNMSTDCFKRKGINAKSLGRALLKDFIFICNKESKDGSAKGNIEPKLSEITWGVLYKIDNIKIKKLSSIEGGYEKVEVKVEQNDQTFNAYTYISFNFTNALPKSDYMQDIINGANEHNLPEDYISMLESIKTKNY